MTEEQEYGETPEARRQRALEHLVRLSEEMGLHESGPTVCVSHMRFVPCRRGRDTGPCSFSDRQEDIDRVTKYQLTVMRKMRDDYHRDHPDTGWEKVDGYSETS